MKTLEEVVRDKNFFCLKKKKKTQCSSVGTPFYQLYFGC